VAIGTNHNRSHESRNFATLNAVSCVMWRLIGALLVLASCSASASGEPTEISGSVAVRETIRMPLTLYVVAEQDAPGSAISSQRTTAGLEKIADDIAPIWAQADVVFDPLLIREIQMPMDVLQELVMTDGFEEFFVQAGRTFEVPDAGVINGFYVREAFEFNGFTPNGSLVFFVADEPTVLDERVSSHEIGHILGLAHDQNDPTRLMFSGTNGADLTEAEQRQARTTALGILGQTSTSSLPLSIENSGGSLEGHTPRGFAGIGKGLFAGDNLNPGFPDGDGVQAWLNFDLPGGLDVPISAVLTTDALVVQGSPFEDLGNLNVESVRYDEFSSELFDLAANGEASTCERLGESQIDCDVTDAVVAALAAGESRVQLRLKFDIVSDGDGAQDLALFFLTDSNTNEPGIFRLELS
jgi:hypothetical protein